MTKISQETSIELQIAETLLRLENLERLRNESIAWDDGTVVRVRIGKQPDTSFGLRVFNSAGALIHDFTTF